MTFFLFIAVLVIATASFLLSRQHARALAGDARLHSRPPFHGLFAFLWAAIVGIVALIAVGLIGDVLIDNLLMSRIADRMPDAALLDRRLVLSDAAAISRGRVSSSTDELREAIASSYGWMNATRIWLMSILSIGGALAAAFLCYRQISPDFRARNRSERLIRGLLFAMAAIAVLTTIGIVLSLIFETFRFFNAIDWRIDKFLFGTTWSPLSGVFEGNLDADKVGALPLFAGTLMITAIAMLVAVPVGLFAAIYLSEFASGTVRSVAKPLLEVLAGIPTVVYGFFAALTLAPLLRDSGEAIGLRVSSESALAAGIVMGIMIIPFISSLSDDVINSVPQSLRDGSLGVGATQAETVRKVVLPAALPGIVSAVLLGISRAIGETMIVVMAAGQGPNLTANPLEAVTTVTVQIVALITGDTEAATASMPAFTLGFTLFVMTLLMNIAAQRIVRRFREAYE